MTSPGSGIGCIMLAAGYGIRFGADKRQARYPDGATLLERAISRIPASLVPRVLVLRPGDEALAVQFANGWQIVHAQNADKGMGYSLAAAMACTVNWNAAVIALADMPGVQTATYAAIVQALAPDRIVLPCYRQRRGNPVGIGSRFFSELAGLRGDQGARVLLQKHADSVLKLELDDAGILQDIDTPEAFASLVNTAVNDGQLEGR